MGYQSKFLKPAPKPAPYVSKQLKPVPKKTYKSVQLKPAPSAPAPTPAPAPTTTSSGGGGSSAPTTSYGDLEDRNGTIVNKKTGKAYATPAALASDMGIAPHQITWGSISKAPAPAPAQPVPQAQTQPQQPVSAKPAPVQQTQKETETLINIFQSRPDVQATVEEIYPGQDPLQGGTQANQWLNDWWNKHGQSEYPNVKLGQPQAPAGQQPAGQQPTGQTPTGKQPTLIEITSQRPDVMAEAKKQGGDPYTAGAPANTWLNDWYNKTGKAEGADMARQSGMFDQATDYSQLTEKEGTIYKGDKAYGDPAELATDLGIQPHEIDWSKIKKQEPEIKPIDDTEIEGAISPPDLPEAENAVDAYTTSLTDQVASDRKAVEDAYKKQIETTQRQIEASEKKIDELTAKEEDVITGDVQEVLKPWREEKEKAERERLKIEENYFNNQNSIKELEDLLNQAQSEITAAEGVTGLAAIRSPRINKIKEDYAARVGIIQAVMAARNNQIAVGNNLIDRSIAAITADKNDQLNYYNTLLNFYATQKDAEGNKLFNLKADEKDYLNRQIGLIENDLAQSQATVNYIKEMMLNPETAEYLDKAGIKLNDSIETIQAKFANFSYAQEVRDQVSQMSGSGYQLMTTPQMIADKDPSSLVRLTDTHGTERVYYIDEDKLLSPNEAATLGVAYGTTRGQAAQMGITPARWKGTGGGGDTPTKEFTRVKQIIAQHPNEWGHAADQIDREFGAGTATKYDDYLKGVYADKPEEEELGSKWEREATVWQWLETDEAKNLSDEEKASQIRSYGLNPETFGIY